MSTKEKNSHCYLGDLESILRLCSLSSFYCIHVSQPSRSPWFITNLYISNNGLFVQKHRSLSILFLLNYNGDERRTGIASLFLNAVTRRDVCSCSPVRGARSNGRIQYGHAHFDLDSGPNQKQQASFSAFNEGNSVKVDNHLPFYIIYTFLSTGWVYVTCFEDSLSISTPPPNTFEWLRPGLNLNGHDVDVALWLLNGRQATVSCSTVWVPLASLLFFFVFFNLPKYQQR